jgi:hypothetical protein
MTIEYNHITSMNNFSSNNIVNSKNYQKLTLIIYISSELCYITKRYRWSITWTERRNIGDRKWARNLEFTNF